MGKFYNQLVEKYSCMDADPYDIKMNSNSHKNQQTTYEDNIRKLFISDVENKNTIDCIFIGLTQSKELTELNKLELLNVVSIFKKINRSMLIDTAQFIIDECDSEFFHDEAFVNMFFNNLCGKKEFMSSTAKILQKIVFDENYSNFYHEHKPVKKFIDVFIVNNQINILNTKTNVELYEDSNKMFNIANNVEFNGHIFDVVMNYYSNIQYDKSISWGINFLRAFYRTHTYRHYSFSKENIQNILRLFDGFVNHIITNPSIVLDSKLYRNEPYLSVFEIFSYIPFMSSKILRDNIKYLYNALNYIKNINEYLDALENIEYVSNNYKDTSQKDYRIFEQNNLLGKDKEFLNMFTNNNLNMGDIGIKYSQRLKDLGLFNGLKYWLEPNQSIDHRFLIKELKSILTMKENNPLCYDRLREKQNEISKIVNYSKLAN